MEGNCKLELEYRIQLQARNDWEVSANGWMDHPLLQPSGTLLVTWSSKTMQQLIVMLWTSEMPVCIRSDFWPPNRWAVAAFGQHPGRFEITCASKLDRSTLQTSFMSALIFSVHQWRPNMKWLLVLFTFLGFPVTMNYATFILLQDMLCYHTCSFLVVCKLS